MKEVDEFGLSRRDRQTIASIFNKHRGVEHVLIFGSRAKGVFHAGSDIDLAITGSDISHEVVRRIKNDFNESSLPYNVDVINFSTLDNADLKEHILRVGKPVYSPS
ncbi:nucleotidyltransferase domain-containing protein [Limibacterium fermenti]|jgi:predicted nucleotidyltransferase|uniref:nucleotidyltransferase domain-containing protein n=1 Tax=Limibacterium fermenti TaxID=3229863 RepID=UPI000E8165A9|nr:hypothetical protein [Porphyromonadaceae bacterium]HBX20881.1 hypothetical protein [Porphyromonadaceae bacterium]HBX47050.1 hypothetical protein [Porphyromonadaceae bacterium]HCM21051.1 hypothetical protein [Porphyromonadaceae bacterium]